MLSKAKRSRLVLDIADRLVSDYGMTLMEYNTDIVLAKGIYKLLQSKINTDKIKPLSKKELRSRLLERYKELSWDEKKVLSEIVK